MDRERLPSGPLLLLPPSMVTPPLSPPNEAKGLALTLETSDAADALLPGLPLLPPSRSAAADSDSLARLASTGSVLMTVCGMQGRQLLNSEGTFGSSGWLEHGASCTLPTNSSRPGVASPAC